MTDALQPPSVPWECTNCLLINPLNPLESNRSTFGLNEGLLAEDVDECKQTNKPAAEINVEELNCRFCEAPYKLLEINNEHSNNGQASRKRNRSPASATTSSRDNNSTAEGGAAGVIDLVDSSSSNQNSPESNNTVPVRGTGAADDAFDLISSDEEDNDDVVVVDDENEDDKKELKRQKIDDEEQYLRVEVINGMKIKIEFEPKKFGQADDPEGDVIEVMPPSGERSDEIHVSHEEVAVAADAGDQRHVDIGDKNDDDIQLVSTNATMSCDLPHARHTCSVNAFSKGRATSSYPSWHSYRSKYIFTSAEYKQNQKFCKNCYCYVCDVPASECKVWNQSSNDGPTNLDGELSYGVNDHCNASNNYNDGDDRWAKARKVATNPMGRIIMQVLAEQSRPQQNQDNHSFNHTLHEGGSSSEDPHSAAHRILQPSYEISGIKEKLDMVFLSNSFNHNGYGSDDTYGYNMYLNRHELMENRLSTLRSSMASNISQIGSKLNTNDKKSILSGIVSLMELTKYMLVASGDESLEHNDSERIAKLLSELNSKVMEQWCAVIFGKEIDNCDGLRKAIVDFLNTLNPNPKHGLDIKGLITLVDNSWGSEGGVMERIREGNLQAGDADELQKIAWVKDESFFIVKARCNILLVSKKFEALKLYASQTCCYEYLIRASVENKDSLTELLELCLQLKAHESFSLDSNYSLVRNAVSAAKKRKNNELSPKEICLYLLCIIHLLQIDEKQSGGFSGVRHYVSADLKKIYGFFRNIFSAEEWLRERQEPEGEVSPLYLNVVARCKDFLRKSYMRSPGTLVELKDEMNYKSTDFDHLFWLELSIAAWVEFCGPGCGLAGLLEIDGMLDLLGSYSYLQYSEFSLTVKSNQVDSAAEDLIRKISTKLKTLHLFRKLFPASVFSRCVKHQRWTQSTKSLVLCFLLDADVSILAPYFKLMTFKTYSPDAAYTNSVSRAIYKLSNSAVSGSDLSKSCLESCFSSLLHQNGYPMDHVIFALFASHFSSCRTKEGMKLVKNFENQLRNVSVNNNVSHMQVRGFMQKTTVCVLQLLFDFKTTAIETLFDGTNNMGQCEVLYMLSFPICIDIIMPSASKVSKVMSLMEKFVTNNPPIALGESNVFGYYAIVKICLGYIEKNQMHPLNSKVQGIKQRAFTKIFTSINAKSIQQNKTVTQCVVQIMHLYLSTGNSPSLLLNQAKSSYLMIVGKPIISGCLSDIRSVAILWCTLLLGEAGDQHTSIDIITSLFDKMDSSYQRLLLNRWPYFINIIVTECLAPHVVDIHCCHWNHANDKVSDYFKTSTLPVSVEKQITPLFITDGIIESLILLGFDQKARDDSSTVNLSSYFRDLRHSNFFGIMGERNKSLSNFVDLMTTVTPEAVKGLSDAFGTKFPLIANNSATCPEDVYVVDSSVDTKKHAQKLEKYYSIVFNNLMIAPSYRTFSTEDKNGLGLGKLQEVVSLLPCLEKAIDKVAASIIGGDSIRQDTSSVLNIISVLVKDICKAEKLSAKTSENVKKLAQKLAINKANSFCSGYHYNSEDVFFTSVALLSEFVDGGQSFALSVYDSIMNTIAKDLNSNTVTQAKKSGATYCLKELRTAYYKIGGGQEHFANMLTKFKRFLSRKKPFLKYLQENGL